MSLSPQDRERFAEMVSRFVDGCRFARPFHLVTIDARGSVSVARYGIKDVAQICAGPSRSHRLKMIPPLVVTAISGDGIGESAVIEV